MVLGVNMLGRSTALLRRPDDFDDDGNRVQHEGFGGAVTDTHGILLHRRQHWRDVWRAGRARWRGPDGLDSEGVSLILPRFDMFDVRQVLVTSGSCRLAYCW